MSLRIEVRYIDNGVEKRWRGCTRCLSNRWIIRLLNKNVYDELQRVKSVIQSFQVHHSTVDDDRLLQTLLSTVQ